MTEDKNKKEQEVEEVIEQDASLEQEPAEKESKQGKKSDKKKAPKEKSAEQIKKLEDDLSEIKDKHMRLQAEFDNYRKRTLKEKMELMKSGGEGVLMNILPVIDDFERALVAFSEMDDDNPLKLGVNLIYSKFQDFLKQNGIKEIEAKEKEFDTDLHEAVTKIPAPSDELKGKVVDVIQKGYTLNEKVIRYSKVVIGE